MLDLSDWIWLAVVVIWVVGRAVLRLVRGVSKQTGPAPPSTAGPPTPTPTRPGSRSSEPKRLGDVGPGPIEPR